MKISGAGAKPLLGLGPRSPVSGQPTVAPAAETDQVRFLGISEAELTPSVAGAIAALTLELDDLRAEVRRLKDRLGAAEAAADADPLTGVRNRRAFFRELKRTVALAARHGLAISLAYFDVDDLKALNDSGGHAAGDAALRAVAERLSAQVRESDVVGRIGGDEFVVALVQADETSAMAKAAALAAAIEGEPVTLNGAPFGLRISWGVRQIDPSADLESQVAAADAAMFGMKRSRSG